MKRIFSLLFVLAVVVTTTSTVYAQCSNATLTGNYAFNHLGFGARGQRGNEVPFANVGVLTFDGAGNFSVTTTFVSNGSGGQPFADTGTYTVNSDCTGTFTLEDVGIHFNIVMVGGGAEFFGIQTDIGTTTTIDAKKQ